MYKSRLWATLQEQGQPAGGHDEALSQAAAAGLPSDEDELEDEPASPGEQCGLSTAASSSSSPVAPFIFSKAEAQRPAATTTTQLPAGLPQVEAASARLAGPAVFQPATGQQEAELQRERAAAAALPEDDDDDDYDDEDSNDNVQAGASHHSHHGAPATAFQPNDDNAALKPDTSETADTGQNGQDQEEQQRRDQAAATRLPSR